MTLIGKIRDSDETESFAAYGFNGGLNIKSMPQELDDGDLTVAYNVNLRVDGGIEMRKGMNARGGPLGSGVGKNIIRFSQTIVNGVPVSLTNPTRFLLAQIGDTLWNYDGSSQIGATGALGLNSLPWSTVQAYDGDHVLAPPPAPTVTAGVSGAGTSLNGTYNVLITWINPLGESLASSASSVAVGSGASLGISSPALYGNAVSYAYYVSTAGGGSNTATKQGVAAIGNGVSLASLSLATSLPTSNAAIAPSDVLIMCTGVGGPYYFDGSIIYTPTGLASLSGARWVSQLNGIAWFGGIQSQSNEVASTLVGNHVETLGSVFSMTAPVTGLAPLGAGALGGMTIGHYKGLSVIYGTGSSNFFQNDFIHTDYPDAGRTMIAVNGLIFFLGSTAIWMFDGTNITRISDKVEPWILNDPLHPDFPMNGNRTLSFCWFYNNRLHFAYDTGNLGLCSAYLVFDLIVQGWTLFFGPQLSGACLLDAPGDSDPHACVVMDATTGQAYNWDQYNGQGTNGHGVWDNGNPILSTFQTKYFKIEEPGCAKKLVRWYPEMFVESFTGQFTTTSNYGIQTYSQGQPLATHQMMWDVSDWDAANWASAAPVFFQPKLEIGNATGSNINGIASQLADTSLEFEAMCFGVQNNPSDPPFQFAGASGEIVFEPRS